jgi:hypothetical protein
VIKIGRQIINGLIQKTPHNANYRELYNVVLGLKNQPFYYYVTQAEYDALPQEEKDDPKNIYEITDSDGELPNELQGLIDDITFAKETYEAAITNDTNLDVVNAKTSSITGEVYESLKHRLDDIDLKILNILSRLTDIDLSLLDVDGGTF